MLHTHLSGYNLKHMLMRGICLSSRLLCKKTDQKAVFENDSLLSSQLVPLSVNLCHFELSRPQYSQNNVACYLLLVCHSCYFNLDWVLWFKYEVSAQRLMYCGLGP